MSARERGREGETVSTGTSAETGTFDCRPKQQQQSTRFRPQCGLARHLHSSSSATEDGWLPRPRRTPATSTQVQTRRGAHAPAEQCSVRQALGRRARQGVLEISHQRLGQLRHGAVRQWLLGRAAVLLRPTAGRRGKTSLEQKFEICASGNQSFQYDAGMIPEHGVVTPGIHLLRPWVGTLEIRSPYVLNPLPRLTAVLFCFLRNGSGQGGREGVFPLVGAAGQRAAPRSAGGLGCARSIARLGLLVGSSAVCSRRPHGSTRSGLP